MHKVFSYKSLLFFVFIQSHFGVFAQDTSYARRIINSLCADKLHGRGYYKDGALKAADFIGAEMKKIGLKKLPGGKKYYQAFTFEVNTIQKVRIVTCVNCWAGVELIPGVDYLVDAACPEVGVLSSLTFPTYINDQKLEDTSFVNSLLVKPTGWLLIDTISEIARTKYKEQLSQLKSAYHVFEVVKNKLTWTVATRQSGKVHIQLSSRFANKPTLLNNGFIVEVVSNVVKTTQKNVIGYVKGVEKPDSFIFVTAHYDHLGRMGEKAIFPGANDNACGVAMMLDMARYYAKNKPKYSMVFVAFAGEEAGLIGSEFFVQNPLIPLKNIRFSMNLDLVGTGEDGGVMVNGSVFKKEFSYIDSINKEHRYLSLIKTRGKAANSDHYFFTEAGVPSFFLYLGGPRGAYHDVYDVPGTLTLFGYKNTFRLLTDFFSVLQK